MSKDIFPVTPASEGSQPESSPIALVRPVKDLDGPLSQASRAKLANLRAIGLDVDGVLTDGGFWWGEDGQELKRFHFLDVMGISRARRAGLIFALISGEDSPLVDRYAKKLGIDHVYKGVKHKGQCLELFALAIDCPLPQVAFMGDDINDLSAMEKCGFSVCPATGHRAVRESVDLVTTAAGGHGAVRELLDLWNEASGKT